VTHRVLDLAEVVPGVVAGEVHRPVPDEVVERLETDGEHRRNDEDEDGDVIPVEKEVYDRRGPLTLIVAHWPNGLGLRA